MLYIIYDMMSPELDKEVRQKLKYELDIYDEFWVKIWTLELKVLSYMSESRIFSGQVIAIVGIWDGSSNENMILFYKVYYETKRNFF